MSHWLLKARSALLHDNASSLDAARKLAVVNGLGEHSRAQVLLSGLLLLLAHHRLHWGWTSASPFVFL